MATPSTTRIFKSFVCQSCRQRLLPSISPRSFSSSTPTRAEETAPPAPTPSPAAPAARPKKASSFDDLLRNLRRNSNRDRDTTSSSTNSSRTRPNFDFVNRTLRHDIFSPDDVAAAAEADKPHRLHIYATKHNTHITLVQPPRPAAETLSSGVSGTTSSAADQKKMVDVLMSISAGNIGFKKAGRGTYDAAYQLAAFALKQMQEKGMLRSLNKLEVVLRGFGAGREAVTKALMGTEGRVVRRHITAVVDATRLKYGGARSPKPRRLG